ncbi:hypothetical protein THRCLA_06392 [Thraustotheca clavata]|uniref:Secreted protein n=1 Tax=Thraustotheca clavata TaxID=74557 RepID=A0A1V9ZP53_9STRA|nr:hypothetical protein THRCLA_06392 [Thraustotheca clavata]
MFGWKKLLLGVVAMAAMVSGEANVTADNNSSAVAAPTGDVSPYAAKLFGSLLAQLDIEHIDNKPLTDEEYNAAVNDIEDLITGATPKNKIKKVKEDVRDYISRMTPAELEQYFDDVGAELTAYALTGDANAFETTSNTTSNSTQVANATEAVAVKAQATEQSFLGLNNKQVIISGGAIGGFMLVVAVALAVSANREKKSAPTQSVLADNVIDEIEAAEKSAASPAEKDADVEEMNSESPSVVSV